MLPKQIKHCIESFLEESFDSLIETVLRNQEHVFFRSGFSFKAKLHHKFRQFAILFESFTLPVNCKDRIGYALNHVQVTVCCHKEVKSLANTHEYDLECDRHYVTVFNTVNARVRRSSELNKPFYSFSVAREEIEDCESIIISDIKTKLTLLFPDIFKNQKNLKIALSPETML
jgi:hypothetical protein